MVSRWVWLYIGLSPFLSLMILAWWRVSSRRKLHEIDGAFGETSEVVGGDRKETLPDTGGG